MSDRTFLLGLLALSAARLLAAVLVPLAPDEAYYWVWSHDLSPGYYDHPPMVAAWIAAGTALLGEGARGAGLLGIRLLGPLGVAAASLALWRAGNRLFPERRPGAWAAALLNATLLLNAGAVLVTPDTPLVIFWCLALWAAAEAQAGRDGRWWLAVGLFAGLALLSKYTAVLLGAGLGLWLLAEPTARPWLRDWRLWAGGLLAGLVFSPVILWNAAHGWASFAKQGGRAGMREGGVALRYLGELLGGQAALVTPVIFLLCLAGLWAATRAWWRRDAAAGLLAALSWPAVLLFLWQATGGRVQGNWPAILYPALCLAAAACLGGGWARWRWPALASGLLITLAALVQATAAPAPLPRGADPTLARLGGWDGFAARVEAARIAAGADFIAAEEYGLASELALRLPPGTPVVAIGDRWDLFDFPEGPLPPKGLLVRSERRGDGLPLWPGAGPVLGEVVRERRGIPAERYRLHRFTVDPALRPVVPFALLPRP
ncbi:glycosyltransferase family 39 protein [Roseomonas sp. OT10]|uniref:glycosyltransferase family 39 protein n=1 Tax=Roseomonas cutis TaxID=2897332 RepID=UPI001E5F47F4|nr:glycosyltransferase family 39 protein [Roseomonas sp. OT10]UFN51021.1 glycosyltransferase family 39 protein [Roseomonas sp. OT10]